MIDVVLSNFSRIPGKLNQTLPVAIIAFCLSDGGGRRINVLRMYLYLNLRSRGQGIDLNVRRKKQMGEHLGLAVSTINKWLRKDLAILQWVRKSRVSGLYYVSGFKDVVRRLPESFQDNRSSVIVDPIIRHADPKRFKAWMAGAFIGDLARYMSYLSYKGKLREYEELQGRNFRRSHPKESATSRFWWPISKTMIAARLKVGEATAILYRALAKEYGFLLIKHNRRVISERERQARVAMGGKHAAMIHDDGRGRLTVDETHNVCFRNYEFRRLTGCSYGRWRV